MQLQVQPTIRVSADACRGGFPWVGLGATRSDSGPSLRKKEDLRPLRPGGREWSAGPLEHPAQMHAATMGTAAL